MIRAGHTLCGIHRTGGFPMVAATARSLEQTLLALAERGAPLPSNAQPALARAVAGLTQFVHRVEAREAFSAGDQTEAGLIQADLDELRQESASHAQDAEAAAAAFARREDESHASALAAVPDSAHADVHHVMHRARTSRAGMRTLSRCRGRRARTKSSCRWRWRIRWPRSATTWTSRSCRFSWTKLQNCSRRQARNCARGAAIRTTASRRANCAERCTR